MYFEQPIPDGRTITRLDVFLCWLFGHGRHLHRVKFWNGQSLHRCTRCGAWRP